MFGTESFLVAGIDTGYQLGFVVFETFVNLNEIKSLNVFLKLSKKKTLKPSEAKTLLDILLRKNLLKFVPYHWSFHYFDPQERGKIADYVVKIIKRCERLSAKKINVFIEDFLFFSKTSSKKASWFTVTKVQNTIGFLVGYFYARKIETKLVRPRTWKSIVDTYYIDISSHLFPSAFKKEMQESHILSAVGIALSGIPELVFNCLKQKCIKNEK